MINYWLIISIKNPGAAGVRLSVRRSRAGRGINLTYNPNLSQDYLPENVLSIMLYFDKINSRLVSAQVNGHQLG